MSRSDAILWPSIARLARAAPGKPIRVSGPGQRWWRRAHGIDVAGGAGAAGYPNRRERHQHRSRAVRSSVGQPSDGAAIRFSVLDVLNDPIPEGYDVVTCSLFLHHLDEAGAVALLSKMANAAGRLVLVNDLVRGRIGYVLAWVGCHLLSRSPIVRHDGPVSVAGAYTIPEVSAAGGAGWARWCEPVASLAMSIPPPLESGMSMTALSSAPM